MSVLGNVINWILGLGAAIFVPIIIIIAGLIVGMKLKDAISAGITLGVAFTGMSMLIGFMSDAIGPAAKAMLTHTGINLPIVDGGWTTLSAIAWSWPYAFLMFPLMIGLNILMLIINKTKTFNADLWNVWGKIFTGVAVAAVSKPYFGTAASIALGLGAAIFVPIIIIIAGLIVGMKLKDAISAGITLGVAFTGMSMLIGFMSDAIGPAAKAMLTHTGINLPIVDGGWTTLSAIAWSWPYAFLMFPLMIGLNILMLIINKTKTFNADLWNVWGKIFTGVAVAAVSKPYFGTAASIALAFIVAGIQIIFELKMADMYQYRIEKLSGIPGVTCTHKMGFTSIFMFPIDCILKKIPALNKRFDAAALKDKIGIFAESHVLGFILGIIFGILARYSVAATLTLGIQASCALTLFPVISKYFMMALEPISSAISAFMNKKFDDRTLVVGLDWPFMGGANEIWLAVFWAIPVTLVFSMFLPGNEILPFAGIVNNAIAVAAFLVTGGNIIRMLILVTLFAPAYLWVGTIMAPFISDLARSTGAVALKAGELISCSSIDGPIQTYAFSHVFKIMDGNFLPLVLCVIFVVCFIALYKYLGKEEAEGREIN